MGCFCAGAAKDVTVVTVVTKKVVSPARRSKAGRALALDTLTDNERRAPSGKGGGWHDSSDKSKAMS